MAISALGAIGVAYAANLALLALKRIGSEEHEPWWSTLLRVAAYACLLVSGVAFLRDAGFADEASAIATVVLLILALRQSWIVTLRIAKRDRKQ